MSGTITGAARPAPPAASATSPAEDLRLRRTAQQLEGVFVEQLFKAMRETVPDGGLIDGGAGEEIFNSMLDQHLSTQLPDSWERGLGAAIYRQLRSMVPQSEPPADTLPKAGATA